MEKGLHLVLLPSNQEKMVAEWLLDIYKNIPSKIARNALIKKGIQMVLIHLAK